MLLPNIVIRKSHAPADVFLFCISYFVFSRDLSLEVLKREPEGSFIVRASNSKNGLALSVRVPQDFHPEGIVHYLIIRSPKGFKIKVIIRNKT